jgi:hypothetical protein
MLRTFQEVIKKIMAQLRKILYGDQGTYNHELYKYIEPNKVKWIKVGRMNTWDAIVKRRGKILARS